MHPRTLGFVRALSAHPPAARLNREQRRPASTAPLTGFPQGRTLYLIRRQDRPLQRRGQWQTSITVSDTLDTPSRPRIPLFQLFRTIRVEVQSVASDASNNMERAATMGERAYRAVGDLRVAMTSQNSAISTTLERFAPRSGKLGTVEDFRRIAGLEISKAKLATTEMVETSATKITNEIARRYATINEHIAQVHRDVESIHNSSRFQRELLVHHAEFVDMAEFNRKKTKKGAVRTTTLIGSAAPYMRPPVTIAANEGDPLFALFRHEELADQLAGDLSPLTAVSPEYEPEDGEIVEATEAPAASSSTGGN
ncbi:hypothetical protein AURDEDRAFT_171503 [Auricularia subglabra TFB-10046 SS5]|nr:hypothetical protein AURDEDRAFT_171503 [Auricularia subglabra TFB-10046 SS5]